MVGAVACLDGEPPPPMAIRMDSFRSSRAVLGGEAGLGGGGRGGGGATPPPARLLAGESPPPPPMAMNGFTVGSTAMQRAQKGRGIIRSHQSRKVRVPKGLKDKLKS